MNATPATDFAAVRARLGARAREEGLLDIAIARHDAPDGPLLLAATEVGLVRVALAPEPEDAVLQRLAEAISPRIMRAPHPALETARRELDAYFAGALTTFTVPLDRRLSRGFRRAVLDATAAIPYGATASYAQVAAAAGNPRAARAAGTALATNPLPIIVPCHRVLRSGGEIGDYLGGTPMKEHLLAMEAAVTR
ncbi:MAG: methylated-DNA--[protein]-cysteine S-methyltransferase [Thermoleophilia bacterium]